VMCDVWRAKVGLSAAAPCILLESVGLSQSNARMQLKKVRAGMVRIRTTPVVFLLSHVTRHTSHVTRHTSHVTRHTSRQFLSFSSVDDMAESILALEHAIALAMVNQSR
jgi:hypothetical protein